MAPFAVRDKGFPSLPGVAQSSGLGEGLALGLVGEPTWGLVVEAASAR